MDKEIQRLRWQCRRGMLELDVILNNFLDKHYVNLSKSRQQQFQHLLSVDDQDLFAWLMGHQEPNEPTFIEIVNIIRENYHQ